MKNIKLMKKGEGRTPSAAHHPQLAEIKGRIAMRRSFLAVLFPLVILASAVPAAHASISDQESDQDSVKNMPRGLWQAFVNAQLLMEPVFPG